MNTRSTLRASDKWILILLASASIIVVGVWPLFVNVLADSLELDITHQGWLISAESLGMVGGTALSAWICRHASPRRTLLVSAAFAIAANLLTVSSDNLTLVLALRGIAGLTAGVMYSVAVFHLGRMPRPDRAFGVLLAIQTLIFSAYAVAFPAIAEHLGKAFAVSSVGLWFVFLWAISYALSGVFNEKPESKAALAEIASASSGAYAYLGLAGMLMLQLSIYAVWGFIGNIGGAQGINEADIGLAFGIGLLGGLPGAALAGLLGTRLGRTPMIICGALMVLLADLLLARGPAGATGLTAAIFLMNVGWMLALSFYMGLIATTDRNGTATSLIGLVQISAATLAPAAVAMLSSDENLQPIFVISCSCAALAALVPLFITRRAYAVQAV
ncbi:MFS transporter [Pantoea sp. Tr-811]|uniref:MFS transporter n=1 Tax=Pantoea sp. Tr-811 TaxID=2608361 RepID=UPI0014212360|nr:MFS transporter [Pantoea sp. Tr-811]NIF28941.1 MFS transporter [Pantoea sp. Tr-811]